TTTGTITTARTDTGTVTRTPTAMPTEPASGHDLRHHGDAEGRDDGGALVDPAANARADPPPAWLRGRLARAPAGVAAGPDRRPVATCAIAATPRSATTAARWSTSRSTPARTLPRRGCGSTSPGRWRGLLPARTGGPRGRRWRRGTGCPWSGCC